MWKHLSKIQIQWKFWPLLVPLFPCLSVYHICSSETSSVLTHTMLCLSPTASGMTGINQCRCNSSRDHPDSMTPAQTPVAERAQSLVSLLIWPSATALCGVPGFSMASYATPKICHLSRGERPFVSGGGVNPEDSHGAKMVRAESFRLLGVLCYVWAAPPCAGYG